MDAQFSAMHEANVKGGRPDIAPRKLMRGLRLQLFSGRIANAISLNTML
jgi:hypothetical protein